MSAQPIVTAPQAVLRQISEPIEPVDGSGAVKAEVLNYAQFLIDTIKKQKDPAAAGLALPQIDRLYRAFATNLENFQTDGMQIRVFINPVIVDISDKLSTGPNLRKPDLEGCLSIPDLYGPVLRPEWVTFEYQEIEDGRLTPLKRDTFYDFAGRVMQHELDHLNGVLFTDYTLSQSQPLYRSEKGERIAIDPMISEAF